MLSAFRNTGVFLFRLVKVGYLEKENKFRFQSLVKNQFRTVKLAEKETTSKQIIPKNSKVNGPK